MPKLVGVSNVIKDSVGFLHLAKFGGCTTQEKYFVCGISVPIDAVQCGLQQRYHGIRAVIAYDGRDFHAALDGLVCGDFVVVIFVNGDGDYHLVVANLCYVGIQVDAVVTSNVVNAYVKVREVNRRIP